MLHMYYDRKVIMISQMLLLGLELISTDAVNLFYKLIKVNLIRHNSSLFL